MKKVREEIYSDSNGLTSSKTINEIRSFSLVPVLSIVLSALTSIVSVLLVTYNSQRQRDFEFRKIKEQNKSDRNKLRYEGKFKTASEMLTATGEIINYVDVQTTKNHVVPVVPESLSNKFNDIYYSRFKLYYNDTDSIVMFAEEFKDLVDNQATPNELRTVNKKFYEHLKKDIENEQR